MGTDKAIKMLTLQSKNTYSRLLELSYEDGSYREARRVAVNGVLPTLKINGVFDFLNGILVALYAFGGNLFLRIGDDVIQILGDVRVELEQNGFQSKLTVMRDGRALVLLNYPKSASGKIKDDPTPFVDDEDFDFGLFVKNLVSDPKRRNVALENWGEERDSLI